MMSLFAGKAALNVIYIENGCDGPASWNWIDDLGRFWTQAGIWWAIKGREAPVSRRLFFLRSVRSPRSSAHQKVGRSTRRALSELSVLNHRRPHLRTQAVFQPGAQVSVSFFALTPDS
jgi:hypothetical protein